MGQQLAALRPEGVQDLTHGLLAAALGDPRDRAPVVVGDHHQVLILALAPGLLIDPDPPQPRQPVPPRRRVRRDPGHDAFHRVPRDPQFLRGLRPRHLRGEPCRVQLEHRSKPVGVRGPRHRRGDLPVLGTDDPRHLRLDERPLAVHIQRPPPPDIGLHAFAAGAALRAPATASRLRLHHDDQDLLRRAALPRPRLDIRRDHLDALAVEHLIPHRPGHRTNPAVSNHHVQDRDAIPGQPARFRPTRYAGYLKPRYLKGRESPTLTIAVHTPPTMTRSTPPVRFSSSRSHG